MNASYQASLVNRHIRRFTGLLWRSFPALAVAQKCYFQQNMTIMHARDHSIGVIPAITAPYIAPPHRL